MCFQAWNATEFLLPSIVTNMNYRVYVHWEYTLVNVTLDNFNSGWTRLLSRNIDNTVHFHINVPRFILCNLLWGLTKVCKPTEISMAKSSRNVLIQSMGHGICQDIVKEA